ncbi:type II toxin-antitoxin system VapC family toxin [Cellvibrio sp. KY-GH-1]|uniref:type II toxin-antitoxin system VapC family toxin n=1 Tax=Cellvibrio sp. KY-GH-1 TaxID=2303332 RepID=UPI001244565C|nr:type II toxin-antitoxin system VapC family toxin [Cellvibrio sp. KY-GH-1]QEY18243.1 type II toxin-antitoxin system VapC family toxin [Cellvibrio sp. KY-GH-1]
MRILLDTHIYLWWLTDSPRLSQAAKQTIATATEAYISSASIWEAGIKITAGKLEADIDDLIEGIQANGFTELPITAKHSKQAARLPDIHRDPFDRMLVAQTLCEPLRLLTADEQILKYSELVDLVEIN